MLRVCKKGFVQSLFQFLSYKGSVHVKPGSEGVDAFSTSCAGENNWLVPPVHLNSRTILHLEVSKEGGALLFAKWPFGSLLAYSFPNTRLSVRYVLEIIDPTGVFALRDYIVTIFSPFRFRSSVLVVRHDASLQWSWPFRTCVFSFRRILFGRKKCPYLIHKTTAIHPYGVRSPPAVIIWFTRKLSSLQLAHISRIFVPKGLRASFLVT